MTLASYLDIIRPRVARGTIVIPTSSRGPRRFLTTPQEGVEMNMLAPSMHFLDSPMAISATQIFLRLS
jgi:hypothetical protein